MSLSTKPVAVAVALIQDDKGRFLISRRLPCQHQGGRLEFPGGKIETGESCEAALIRELWEELGISVRPEQVSPRPFVTVDHQYPDLRVRLDVRRVQVDQIQPIPKLGQQLHWLGLERIDAEEFPDANVPIIRRLKSSNENDPGGIGA